MSILRKKCCCGATLTPMWRWTPCFSDGQWPAIVMAEDHWEAVILDGTTTMSPTFNAACTGATYELTTGGEQVLSLGEVSTSCNSTTGWLVPLLEPECGTFSFEGYRCPDQTCTTCVDECNPPAGETWVALGCGTEPSGWKTCLTEVETIIEAGLEADVLWLEDGYVDGVGWNGMWTQPAGDFDARLVVQAGGPDDACCDCFQDTCQTLMERVSVTASTFVYNDPEGYYTATVTPRGYAVLATQLVGFTRWRLRVDADVTVTWNTNASQEIVDQREADGFDCCDPCPTPTITHTVTNVSSYAVMCDTPGGATISGVQFDGFDIPSNVPGLGGVNRGPTQQVGLFDGFQQGCPPQTPVTEPASCAISNGTSDVLRTPAPAYGNTYNCIVNVGTSLHTSAGVAISDFATQMIPFPVTVTIGADPCP